MVSGELIEASCVKSFSFMAGTSTMASIIKSAITFSARVSNATLLYIFVFSSDEIFTNCLQAMKPGLFFLKVAEKYK